jgi:hypothetical protein
MIDVLDRLNEVFLAAKQSFLEMPATVQLPPRREADARNRIFLVQGKEDKQSVRQLYATLKNLRSNPWLDEVDLLPGHNWRIEIQKAIRDAGVFLACLSSNAVAKQGYIKTEFRTALTAYSERPPGAIYVIPVKLNECEVPDIQIPDQGATLRDFHWVELWEEAGEQQLVNAIKHALATSR